MSTTVQPEAPTTSPAITDQRIRLVLEAEIWKDIDGGPDTLCVTTDQLACEPVAPARLLRMVADARVQLDRIERLVKEFEARDTLTALLAEHNLCFEEWDTSTLDPKLRSALVCFAMLHTDGRTIIVVPAGQDPAHRLAAVRALLAQLEATA